MWAQEGEKPKREELELGRGLTALRANLGSFTIAPGGPSSEPSEQRDFLSGGAVVGAVLQGHLGDRGQGSHQGLTHPEDAVISPGLSATMPVCRNSTAPHCPGPGEGVGGRAVLPLLGRR